MPVVECWATHEDVIREAARVVRNQVLHCSPSLQTARRIAMGSLARAAWRNDSRLATAVLANFEEGRDLVAVSEGQVRLLDAHRFAATFDRLEHARLELKASEALSAAAGAPDSARAARELSRRAGGAPGTG